MMSVRVVCRYCQRPFGEPTKTLGDPFIENGQPYYQFECKACNSTQYFEGSGRPLHYLFWVGPYKLYFITNPVAFYMCNGNLGPIFKLDHHPNFTPQNMTEERIKTLILFS